VTTTYTVSASFGSKFSLWDHFHHRIPQHAPKTDRRGALPAGTLVALKPMRFARMPSHFSDQSAPGFPDEQRGVTRGSGGKQKASVRRVAERCRSLLSDGWEVSGSRLADDVLAGYVSLDSADRAAFFDVLAREFSTDPAVLQRAAEGYLDNPSDAARLDLKRACDSPRPELFLRLNTARGGAGLLVHMREQLLQGVREHSGWAAIEADLAQVLTSIFNRGLLAFERIDCDTPAPVLEKLIQYEAVHTIHDWRDMRRRLEADRRCYAFFHPAWPGEPLIFTEVALMRGVGTKVQPILDPASPVADPDACDAAVFYSITSCQPGLRGLSFGNALIGRATAEMRAELPRLRMFATLSPIPGFRPWLSALAASLENPSKVIAVLAKIESGAWRNDQPAAAELEHDLLALCSHYLLGVKRGADPADPVARFHLANGARLRRVNWLSDLSRAGVERSVGLTANYLYCPTDLERNSRTYGRERRINSTRRLERLSRQGAEICGPLTPAAVEWPISA
jgi:malonyl-CoA decarboxylase